MWRWYERIRGTLFPTRVDREVAEEMRRHLEMEVRDRIARGQDPAEARRVAMRDFGGVERYREQVRDGRWSRHLDLLSIDLRFALRTILKNPTFNLVILVTLGIGIGGTTAIFSVVNGVLLSPLPYDGADRLVRIKTSWQGSPQAAISPAEYLDYQTQLRSFDAVGVYSYGSANFTGGERPTSVAAANLSHGVLPAIGVQPVMGRFFTQNEDNADATVVLVREGFWKSALAGDPDVLGRTLDFDGFAVEVIGVLPDDFRLPEDLIPGSEAQLFFPIGIVAENVHNRGSHYLRGIGRVRQGVSVDEATREVEALAARMVELDGDAYPRDMEFRATLAPLSSDVVGSVRPLLLTLLGAVGFVLLIVCANVANLLLSRAEDREREFAVRIALGASRGRIVRQLIVESGLLALMGGVLGLVVATIVTGVLVSVASGNLPMSDGIGMDGGVLGFALLLSLLTGVIFGLAPALYSAREKVSGALREGRGSAGGKRSRRVLKEALVVGQLSLALLLLAGAGLLTRSLLELLRVDTGFRTENIVSAFVSVPSTRYPSDEEVTAFFRELTDRLTAMPIISHAGVTSALPLRNPTGDMNFRIEGREIPEGMSSPHADWVVASPGYFDAIGLSVVRGRGIELQDVSSGTGAVVINETFADLHWPGESPLGHRFELGGDQTQPKMATVVGVVRDVRQNSMDQVRTPQMYMAHDQFRFWSSGNALRGMLIAVESTAPVVELQAGMRAVLAEMDPNLPLSGFRTIEEVRARAVARPRLLVMFVAVFSAVALLLAVVGVYGVMAHAVGRRTREFGVRIALGAGPGQVSRLVVRDGARLVGLGIGVGLMGALAIGRILESFLYQVRPNDPVTLVGVAVLLAVVALVACYLPALKATRVDPMTSLRAD